MSVKSSNTQQQLTKQLSTAQQPIEKSFLEIGQWKRATERIVQGNESLNNLAAMIQERASLEKKYSADLQKWSLKFSKIINKSAEYNSTRQSEKFEIEEQELSQAPKSLEVIVDREAMAVRSLQSSLSQNSGYVSCKFSENYLLFSNGLKFEWEGIIYSCETEPKSCGFIFKDDDSFSMLLLNFEAEPEFFKMMQEVRVNSQK